TVEIDQGPTHILLWPGQALGPGGIQAISPSSARAALIEATSSAGSSSSVPSLGACSPADTTSSQVETPATVAQAAAPTGPEPSPLPRRTRPAPTVGATEVAPEPAPRGPSALGRELELLGEADAALKKGNAQEALGRLDEHRRRFPAGALL